MKTANLYTVTAISHSGARKVIASRIGGMRATRLANEIQARGFAVEVSDDGQKTVNLAVGSVQVLTD